MNDFLKFGAVLALGIVIGRVMSPIEINVDVDAEFPVTVKNVQMRSNKSAGATASVTERISRRIR